MGPGGGIWGDLCFIGGNNMAACIGVVLYSLVDSMFGVLLAMQGRRSSAGLDGDIDIVGVGLEYSTSSRESSVRIV